MKVLFVNNKDSFVWNLVDYVSMFEPDTLVVPNTISLDEVRSIAPGAIVISPGPGNPHNPEDIGTCIDIIKAFGPTTPTLGVCLGHQAIAFAFGAKIIHSPSGPVHGKTSQIIHSGTGIYEGLPELITGGRYHSLVVDESTLTSGLEVSARTEDGIIMGIRHRQYPVEGIQFHPESVLTPVGLKIIENFLTIADALIPYSGFNSNLIASM
jgi:anthranilate synthase component 2